MIALRFQPRATLRLDAGKFQFLGKDLRELFHGEVDFEDVCARSITGLTITVFVDFAGRERCSGFSFTLSDTTCVSASEAEVRHFDLRNRDADKILSLLADQLALRNVFLQVLLDLAPNDLPEPKIIL